MNFGILIQILIIFVQQKKINYVQSGLYLN